MRSVQTKLTPDFIVPDWPAPANVRALVTTRGGGVSSAPFDSFNLADHVGDAPAAVAENRRRLRQHLPAAPVWLQQVHGIKCADAQLAGNAEDIEADAAFTRASGVVCAVLTADCLPVLLCDDGGTVVAAAHAGWRGLAAGVIEATVAAMNVPPERLLAWLGPAIGPTHFEVGGEVRETFLAHDATAAAAFVPGAAGKWRCDIYLLARQQLAALGIRRTTSADFNGPPRSQPRLAAPHGGADVGLGRPCTDFCTVRDAERFYSYRRDGATGRMASLIWIAD